MSWRNQYTRIVHGELTHKQTRHEAAWTTWRSGAHAAIREARRDPSRVELSSPREAVAVAVPPPRAIRESAQAAVVDTAHSEELAQRIREVVSAREGVTEGRMFGGFAWMVSGNIACGTMGGDLLVRVDTCDRDRVLAEASVRPLRRGKRTMRGFVSVDSAAIADDAELARWIDAGVGYAAWLPPKSPVVPARVREPALATGVGPPRPAPGSSSRRPPG